MPAVSEHEQDGSSIQDKEKEKNSNIRIVGAVAGMGSGLTKVAVGHGFDTVKTRIQVAPQYYTGAIDCFWKIVRNEGPLALYKGATPPALGWAAIDSVLLGSLYNYRLYLRDVSMFNEEVPLSSNLPSISTSSSTTATAPATRLSLLGHGVAGLGAGLTSAFISSPIEVLKVKLQLQHQVSKVDRQFKSPLDCARQVVRAQGVRGLWIGLAGSLAFRANFFWMFMSIEALMRASTKLNGTPFEMTEGTATFLSGGFASFTFWVAAIPADNVKNRVFGAPLDSSTSVRDAVRTIYQSSGWRGYFTGLTPSILRAFPSNACAYFVYEGVLRGLGAEKTRG